MKATTCCNGVLGAVIAASLLACGGGGSQGTGGSNVDFNALHTQYSAPSGRMQASDVPAVMKTLASDEASAAVPVTQSLDRLRLGSASDVTIQNNPPPQCSSSQGGVSCACPGGGSFSETGASSTSSGTTATIDYSSCQFTNSSSNQTYTIDGTLSFADYTSPPPAMLIYSGSLTETITPPGTQTDINLNFALVNGQATYSATVSSGGNVLISENGSWDSSTETGSFTVTDSQGTWSCTATNGHGSCTGPSGTETF
jgi:hypothetical protein